MKLFGKDKRDLLIRESEVKFRSLVQNSPDLIARYDKNMRHVFVNDTVIQQTGFTEKELLHKTPLEMGYPQEIVDPLMKKSVLPLKQKKCKPNM